MKCGVTENPTS